MLFILAQDEEMFGKKLTKEKREINKDMKYSNKQRARQKYERNINKTQGKSKKVIETEIKNEGFRSLLKLQWNESPQAKQAMKCIARLNPMVKLKIR